MGYHELTTLRACTKSIKELLNTQYNTYNNSTVLVPTISSNILHALFKPFPAELMPILDPVAKKLGHHWKRIALELGMGGSIPRIESKYVRLREQALYSLLMWEDTSGVAATQKRLMDALDACGMKRALGEFV